MPTEKLSMRKVREILRLRYEKGFSHRDIGRSITAPDLTDFKLIPLYKLIVAASPGTAFLFH